MSIHGVGYVQRLLWQTLERPLLRISSPSVTHKEKVQQAEPQQVFQVPNPGKTDSACLSPSSKKKVHQEETEHQASKPDVSGQPSTSGVKEGEISLRPQKGPKLVDTNNMCLENIHDFEYLKEWGPTMSAYVVESWHNNPHLKRGDELEIKFITVTSEDMTNTIQYPSFHFMKRQRPDERASTYIKAQETKLALVVNLTKDEVFTRRAWGVWVCLTEIDKVKYMIKIYQNSVNGSFLLNSMTGTTTRFANDMFEQKRTMIWENRLIGMRAPDEMHVI
ncbi:hypothetical protein ACS0TY_023814 [Phlomoides rotata]